MYGKINVKRKTLLVLLLAALAMFVLSYVTAFGVPSALANTETPGSYKQLSLTLSDDIVMCYYFNVPDGVSELKAEFTHNGKTKIVSEYDIVGSDYVFKFDGVIPQHIGTPVNVTLKGTYNGTGNIVIAEKNGLTVKDYCTQALATDKSVFQYSEQKYAAMRTLIADLLDYGAESQKYVGVNTDLVNEGLTEAGSVYTAPLADDTAFAGTVSQEVDWVSAALRLDYKIAVVLKFGATDTENLIVKINKENGSSKEFAATDFVSRGNNIYEIAYYGISVTEFNKTIVASFEKDGEPVGRKLTYSVRSYVYKTDGDAAVGSLVKSVYNYGKSAYAFMHIDEYADEFTLETAPTLVNTGMLTATHGGFSHKVVLPVLSAKDYDKVYTQDFVWENNAKSQSGNVTLNLKNSLYGTYEFNGAVDGVVEIGNVNYDVYDFNGCDNSALSYDDGAILTLNGSELESVVAKNLSLTVKVLGSNQVGYINAFGDFETLIITGDGSLNINAGDNAAITTKVWKTEYTGGVTVNATSNKTAVNVLSGAVNITDANVTVTTLENEASCFKVSDLTVGDVNTNPVLNINVNGNNAIDDELLGQSLWHFKSGTTTVNQNVAGYLGFNVKGGENDKILVEKDATLNVTGSFGIAIGSWDGGTPIIENYGIMNLAVSAADSSNRIISNMAVKNYGTLTGRGGGINTWSLTNGSSAYEAKLEIHVGMEFDGISSEVANVDVNFINGDVKVYRDIDFTSHDKNGLTFFNGGTINVSEGVTVSISGFKYAISCWNDGGALTVNNNGTINKWYTVNDSWNITINGNGFANYQ